MTMSDSIAHRTVDGALAARLPDVIEPAWSTGPAPIDPGLFTIDASDHALDGQLHADSELAARMQETFDAVGLVHVCNTGLGGDVFRMRELAGLVIDADMAYDGGSNPRDRMEANVYEVGAPLVAWLHYHHEMAYIGTSTRMLGFLCRHAVPGRGSTYASDAVATTDAILATELGRKLKELGVCYHRNLSDREAFRDRVEVGVYNHWQKSLGTDDPAEAETRARARGLQTEWGPDRLLRTRYYVSAFEYFEPLGRNLLYSSVADHGMWFDAWPLVMHLPYEERPLHLTFGDDSELTREELRQFVEIHDRFGLEIDWRQGDVAIVCNHRFAHGRPAIELADGEQRELGVVLGEAYDRLGDLPHGW